MVRQPKLRPQTPSDFFADGKSSRLPIPGTIAWDDRYQENPLNTGRVAGTTNFLAVLPVPVTEKLLLRGQQRFTINCSPCHGAQGDGNGITKKIGAMGVVANLHDKRIVELADGEIFSTITYGKNPDGLLRRECDGGPPLAVIAYLRALQLSRLGSVEDVPEPMRATLKK